MIASQLEIIQQGQYFLSALNEAQYQQVLRPVFTSSAGAHMRHIIDHYQALMTRSDTLIDYNRRNRFNQIETDTVAAQQALAGIASWIQQLTDEQLLSPVDVVSEISIREQQNYVAKSTLGRELMFVSSHAVHHFFTLKLIAQALHISLDKNFGLAPATASFQRQQQAS